MNGYHAKTQPLQYVLNANPRTGIRIREIKSMFSNLITGVVMAVLGIVTVAWALWWSGNNNTEDNE